MNHNPRPYWLPCLPLLVVSLFACTAEEQSDQTGIINACSLLSQQDIATTISADVSVGYRDDTGWISDGDQAGVYSSTCLWQISSNSNEPEYVILMAMNWPEGKSAQQFLQSFRESAEQGIIGQQPVPLSLGDASLWWGDGVAVAKKQTSFGISTRLSGAREKRRIAEEALASIITSKL